MRKFLLISVSLVTLLFLAACQPEPKVFGVPVSTWNTLTPAEKQQVIDGYNERQLVQEQNAPIQNAIDTAGTILNNPTIMK